MTDFIELRGLRANNLKNISLRLPKRRIVVFTGVSGSGKSSIVFDTIAIEAQRQLFENFSLFIRSFLPKFPAPEADAIEKLNLAVIVDQKRLGGGSHSTVGTATEIFTLLRLLFARIGDPPVRSSMTFVVNNLVSGEHREGQVDRERDAGAFAFNDPRGMCPECQGLGKKIGVIADDFLDLDKSLDEGAIHLPGFAELELGTYTASGFFENAKKLRDYTPEEMELLLRGKDRKFKMRWGGAMEGKPSREPQEAAFSRGGGTMNATYLGIIERFERRYVRRDITSLSARVRKEVEPYLNPRSCPLCHGARISQAALNCRIDGRNIAEFATLEIDALIPLIKRIAMPAAQTILAKLVERLEHMAEIGLGYLSLDRETDTLSGGESQRVKMVRHLGSSLVETIYIFDEPSIGLHPRDVHLLNEHLVKLRDKGNTVLVVEHDPDVIKVADHVVDLGPGAGHDGGRIVFEGAYEALLSAETLTGRHLKTVLPLKEKTRTPAGSFPIRGARVNNLKGFDLDIPAGILVAITGVAGSGKSTLIEEVFLPDHPEAIVIDQSAVGVSSRSNPATWTGIMDHVRKAFAKANKVDASLFSFNSKGACPTCKGTGVVVTELGIMGEFESRCEECRGDRFSDEVLAYRLGGRSIAEVLAMTIAEALAFFKQKEIARRLAALRDVGLDYLTLGQPLSTLSGGECQRLKLAAELHKDGNLYVLDEPTTGLHMADVAHLMEILDRLVEGGNSVIVIEHNINVIRRADWIIDLGPEGGSSGGEVIYSGPPAGLRAEARSMTGRYL